MKVICLCDHKGGIGKTATACAIAQGIDARKRPKGKSLLIDTDPQGSASKTVYGVPEGTPGLYDVMTGSINPNDAIIETEAGAILPYSKQLSRIDVEFSQNAGRDYYLKEIIENITGPYTHVIIDTAPGVSLALTQALTACDSVLIPIMANADGVDALRSTKHSIEVVKKYNNKELEILGTFFTMYSNRAIISRQYEELIEEVAKSLDITLLNTRVRRSVAVEEARALNVNLFTYAPKANATRDYEALIKELKI